MRFDEKIQLIIVGESSVGKTSLLYKYITIILTNPNLGIHKVYLQINI